jgi:hypothetical protein
LRETRRLVGRQRRHPRLDRRDVRDVEVVMVEKDR